MSRFKVILFAALGIVASVGVAGQIAPPPVAPQPRVLFSLSAQETLSQDVAWVDASLTPEQQEAAREAERHGGCITYATGEYRLKPGAFVLRHEVAW